MKNRFILEGLESRKRKEKSGFRLASARDERPADKVILHFRQWELWRPFAPVGVRQHPLGHTSSPLKGFLGRAGETLYIE